MIKILTGLLAIFMSFAAGMSVNANSPIDLLLMDIYCERETSAVQIPSFPFAATDSSARALIFMPVHGISESYDFTMNMNLEIESNVDEPTIQAILAVIGEVNLELRGSVDMNGMGGRMFSEIDLDIPALGIPLEFRLWLEMDFNDVEYPSMISIIESPPILRLMFMGTLPELSRQFLVVDKTDMIREAMDVLPTLMEDLDTIMNIDEDELNELLDELRVLLGGLWAEIEEYVDVEFDFYMDITEENGELTELEFGFSIALLITHNDEFIAINFSIAGTYYNLGNPTPIELPVITQRNSMDLLEWLINSDFEIHSLLSGF